MSNKLQYLSTDTKLDSENFHKWEENFSNIARQFNDAGKLFQSRNEAKAYEIPSLRRTDPTFKGEEGTELYNIAYRHMLTRKQQFEDHEQALVGILISCLGTSTVATRIKADEEYKPAVERNDLLKLWKIVEKHALGNKHHSAYMDVAKLLKMEQGDSTTYEEYSKNFKELAQRLKAREASAEKLLDLILNAKFLMGVDQDQFKIPLEAYYTGKEWPEYKEASELLQRFASAKQTLKSLDNTSTTTINEISANKTSSNNGNNNKDNNNKLNNNNTNNKKQKCPCCGRTNHTLENCFYHNNNQQLNGGMNNNNNNNNNKNNNTRYRFNNNNNNNYSNNPNNNSYKNNMDHLYLQLQLTTLHSIMIMLSSKMMTHHITIPEMQNQIASPYYLFLLDIYSIYFGLHICIN